MTFYINNKRGNGYQPKNRPKNLIPPNKKPSYKPKESNIKEDCKENIQLMAELIKQGLGIKTNCAYCEAVLKFEGEDIQRSKVGYIEFYLNPGQYTKKYYIVCPLCHYKNLVYPEDFGIAINIDKEKEE